MTGNLSSLCFCITGKDWKLHRIYMCQVGASYMINNLLDFTMVIKKLKGLGKTDGSLFCCLNIKIDSNKPYLAQTLCCMFNF